MADRADRDAARRIFGNLARLAGGKAGAALIGLAYLAIAARALGPRDYGVLVLVHGFAMAVGGIVEFPGWHAVVRYGAEARGAGDEPRLVRLLGFAGAVELAAGAVAVIVAALLGRAIGARLGWTPTAVAFALPYGLAVLASIRATPAGYLQLADRFDLLGLHTLAAPAVRLAGAGVALLAGAGLHGFLVAWLIAALAEWALMWLLGLWVAWPLLRRAPAPPVPRTVRRENPNIIRFMLAANADVTLSELAGRLPALVVGAVMGPAAAGLLAIAQRAAVLIAQPSQMLGQAAYTEFARLVAAGERGRLLRATLMRCVGTAMAVALPLLLLIAWRGGAIAAWLGGARFAAAGALMLPLAAARVILLFQPPASAALTALGRPGVSVAANVAANLGLLPLLVPLLLGLGLAGAGAHALIQAAATVMLLGWALRGASGAKQDLRPCHAPAR